MKIILREEVQGVGYEGDIAEVKDGYARNYLIPQGLAVRASEENLAEWEEKKEEYKAKREAAEKEALELKDLIEETLVTITAKAGEGGRIFGSVTNQDIAEKFTEITGKELDRRKVTLGENIKDLGNYTVVVKVFPEITADLEVRVENEEGETSTEEEKVEAKEEVKEEVKAEEVEETTEEQVEE